MIYNRILLAMASPGDLQSAAMEKAARLASVSDAELELFHCAFDAGIPRPGRHDSESVQADVRAIVESRRRELERSAERIRAQNIRARTSVRWDYPPYEGIVRQVSRYKPDLLIAESTRGAHSLRLTLTYTDFKLIETCPCPVMLVKTVRPYQHPRVIAAVDPEHLHDKPAALDDAIVETANALSTALAGEVLVFHARMPWADAARVVRELEMAPEAAGGDAKTAYIGRVEGRVRDLARRHGVADGRVRVVDGYPAESLPPFAREQSADIVTMGAVSRSLLKRIIIGHTAEQLLDALDCDLLVVKPPGFHTPVGEESAHRIDREAEE